MTESQDVRLRALEPEDLDFIYEMENTTDVAEQSMDLAPVSRYAVRRYLESQPADPFSTGELRLIAVVDANTKSGVEADSEPVQRVAIVDLTGIDAYNAWAEVGLAVHPQHRRKGFGLRVLSELERIACERLRLHSLTAQVEQHNDVARALFVAAGYVQIGVLPQRCRRAAAWTDAVLFHKVLGE